MATALPPPKRCLIVNADDFGLGVGINAGIARAAIEGIVTSVSLMANGAAITEAVAIARKWRRISTGAHLALVGGRPVSSPASLPSLVDREGRFPPSYRALLQRWLRGGIRSEEVYREWSAQVVFLRRQGLELTHLDS
ncbi:MAG: ChbG/HpnK family deacetylase, partial [Chloroflexi bacterium]|nr:ChbG/HpnK family deacetylase [Chloroflexota bacterium]